MRIDDRLFGVLVCLLGVATLWYSAGFPGVAKQFYGPALFPTIIGWGFVVTGIFLFGTAVRRPRAGALLSFPDWRGAPRGLASVILMLASVLAFIYLGDAIGFQILSFITLVALYLTAGRGVVKAVAIALVVTLSLDLLFRKLLRVPLPDGLLAGLPLW